MKSFLATILVSVLLFHVILGVNSACADREKNEDEKVGEFIEDVKCQISTGTDKIKEGASKAGTAIKEGASKAGTSIKQGATKVYDVLKSGVSKAGEAVSGGFGFIKSALTPKKEEVVEENPVWDVIPISVVQDKVPAPSESVKV